MTVGTKQRAELRLFLRDESRIALAWQATLYRQDLYAGTPTMIDGAEMMRGSFHASGAAHFHHRGRRLRLDRLPLPLSAVRGTMEIFRSSVSPELWRDDWVPRDSAHRRNLVLGLTAYPVPHHSWAVSLWALEAGHPELADNVRPGPGAVLGRIHADWTDPQILAVVTSIDIETFEKIARALEAEGKTVLGYPRERERNSDGSTR